MALELTAADRPRPKVLVVASTPGRPFGDVILDQLSNILGRQHATRVQRELLQVFSTEDAARFAAVLASRTDGSEVATPLLVSHNLKPAVGDSDPGIAGEVAPTGRRRS